MRHKINSRTVCDAASLHIPAVLGAFVGSGCGNKHSLVGVGHCQGSSGLLQGLWSCFILCPGHFPKEHTALERKVFGVEYRGKGEILHWCRTKVPLI